ncbi:ABC transporter ATP-binding protein [Knoellia aerolata]|uniref:ABC transporter ATP-binding protein n=1 Tax=Knoellia aerolata DSM 18566 TaxID=1385519 RepID=A0A0A0K0H0_9MICO|nr:ABC transporter ATP-binding protein [Knoellia aerolata]KGN42474.1 ABC transporter ATP-binding protein [Knoellia aerolata DSM 18566]
MTHHDSPAVELTALTKSFPGRAGAVQAVRGIDLTVDRGEVVAFLGPNGAGKTTTLDLVLGLTSPTSGGVRVLGQSPRDAVRAGRVSAVLQTGGLLRDLTVRETVELIASTYAVHAPVDDVLRRANLTTVTSRKVSKCSGGEQQRLRFALALLPDPELLILDEPTAGMDVSARHTFWDSMHAEAAAGRTILFATHYLEEADSFAGRIVLVAGGRVVADGPTDVIRGRALGRTVAARLDLDLVDAAVSHLRSLAAVHEVRVDRDRLTVTTSDSDAVARALLNGLAARDLEVTTGSLESAFLALTGTTDTASEGAAA